MQTAFQAFQKGDYKSAIQIYTSIIEANQENCEEALLNRSSANFTMGQYAESTRDVEQYIKRSEKPKVQGYTLFANNLIKQKTLVGQEQKKILEQGKTQYPDNKKFLNTLKIVQELQITEDEDEYMDKIFQKLLSEPKIRNYMQEESFLTKVQKMIKNPALASALIKMDPRLSDVQEIILMAEE